MNKRHDGFTNIGMTSLLVVFLVLCLSTFAMLTLSGAKSDLNFSETAARRKAAYYEACNRVEYDIANIDTALSNGSLLLSSASGFAGFDRDGNLLTRLEPIDEKQALSVVLVFSEDGSYSISTWKVVNTDEWKAKSTLELVPDTGKKE